MSFYNLPSEYSTIMLMFLKNDNCVTLGKLFIYTQSAFCTDRNVNNTINKYIMLKAVNLLT